MKTPSILLVLVLLIGDNGCGRKKNDSYVTNKIDELSINEIINIYDPLLSAKQNSYRLWLEAGDHKTADIFEPHSVGSLSSINDNIDYFMSTQDTVRSYLLYFQNTAAEYGVELITRMKDEEAKEKFKFKWRTYQEGVAEVMNYDLEIINQFLEVLIFLRDNHSKYEIENNYVYFNDDVSLNEYQRLMEVISDPKILVDQQNVRSGTGHTFIEAINIAKDETGPF